MTDAIVSAAAETGMRLALSLAAALLADTFTVAAVVVVVVIVGRHPFIRGVPYLGRAARDLDTGARRLVVAPVERALRTGVPPRRVLWVTLGAVLLVAATPIWARVPAAVTVLWAVGHTWADRSAGWWSHRALSGALVTAGILPRPGEGDPPPSLSYRGAPAHREHGTTVVVGLPGAASFAQVTTKRDRLAAALRVPAVRLSIEQREDDPANVVRITVTNGNLAETPATVAATPVTRWADPVRIGRDAHGHEVTLATSEANTLIAGRPGSGKTSLARVVLAHYLLDPTATVYLLDGKGSREDYGDAVPLFARYVAGTDENAVLDTMTMLTDVLELVRARNTVGGRYPGVLVLLEEFQDVRAAATRPDRDTLDGLLGRIVRMGRAVAVHVLVSTQRPSVDDLPAGVRNLVSQRVALALRNAADAALVLGSTPTLSLPTRRGQGLYEDGTGLRGVILDRLAADAWTAVCGRAAVLRKVDTVRAPRAVKVPHMVPTAAPAPAPLDPLLVDVLRVLADADPRGIPATELHIRLPEWTRTGAPDPRTLGLLLARHPDHVRRVNVGKSRVWQTTDHARTTLAALTQHPRSTDGALSEDCRSGDGAATGPPAATVVRLSETAVPRSTPAPAPTTDSADTPAPTPAREARP